MTTMFTLYLQATTVILCVLTTLALWNLFVFRKRKPRTLHTRVLPMISVLIPARNEEHTIERCVASLAMQEYPQYEIIVLNDNSTDGTSELLERLAKTYRSVRVIQGHELPPGWVGKCFACHQLSQHARGSWLLFTDADTVHTPQSLRHAVELATERRADLLTLIPSQTMLSFGEKLILPLLHFSTFAFLPLYAVEHLRSAKFSIGIGQFMFFRRSAYDAIGGHKAVRDNIVEDVWLARKIKERGLRVIAADGSTTVSCRMYTRWTEVWNGFSKNLFAGFNFSLTAMGAVLMVYAVLFVLPFALAFAAAVHGGFDALQIALIAAQVCLNYLMRTVLAARFKLGIISTILHPLGVLGVIAIGINSWRWIVFGTGARWKERTYKPGRIAGEPL